MANSFEGGGGDEDKKVVKFSGNASRLGESAGFHRRGLPNVEAKSSDENDLDELEKSAEDLIEKMEDLIKKIPELGVSQAEVDAKMREFLDISLKDGRAVLASQLTTVMQEYKEDAPLNREKIISNLALGLAWIWKDDF